MARVKFIRDEEPNILALSSNKKVIDGALYVATDTGSMWLGVAENRLLQINAANLDKDTTYSTGTATYSGTTKLYTGTGTATDGTMTQSAINTALAGKVSSFTATASVDAEVGTPSVTVTKSGTDAAPTFAFAFNNIKGETGSAGSNNIVMVQPSQPTDSHCKIWIKP